MVFRVKDMVKTVVAIARKAEATVVAVAIAVAATL
jgi:hypothetical protein